MAKALKRDGAMDAGNPFRYRGNLEPCVVSVSLRATNLARARSG